MYTIIYNRAARGCGPKKAELGDLLVLVGLQDLSYVYIYIYIYNVIS